MLLTIYNVHIFRNLASNSVELPHKVRLKTNYGEFPAKIIFIKQYENYIRIEGKIVVNEQKPELQRFELNLLNSVNEAKIKIKKIVQN